MLARARILALCLLPAACGGDGGPSAPAQRGAARVALEPGRAVAAYRWEARGSVPALDPGATGIVFGEYGRDPATGLYLTFNAEAPAAELALQPPGWEARLDAAHEAAGRFGACARFSERSVLRCRIPEPGREPPVLSLEFWIKPQALREVALLELPGTLSLGSSDGGWLRLVVPGAGAAREDGDGFEPLRFGSKAPLRAGQWNHVGVVLDLVEMHAARLVVNGQATGRLFELAQAPPAPRELVLGDVAGDGGGLAFELDELRLLRRNVSSAEFEQHWHARPRALERLVIEYVGGSAEEVEFWSSVHGALIDDADDWALGELQHVAIRDGALTWSAEDWQSLPTPAPPLPRTTHPTVALGGGRVFIFGGETRDTHYGRIVNTSDTWILDTTSARWRRILSEPAPSPRCHMPAAYSPDHDLVLVVGGWWNEDKPGYGARDCWAFHVGEERWEERRPPPKRAGAFSDHGLVYLPDRQRFLVLRVDGHWLYDPATDSWEELPPSRAVTATGEPTSYSVGVSTACMRDPASGLILAFGGSYGPQWDVFSDMTALYDPDANTYTVLDTSPRPSPRVRGASAYDPKRGVFVYFGGVQGQFSSRHDDLWVFDPRTRGWREVPRAHDRPEARGGFYGMAYDELEDRFVLTFGRNSAERWLDETLCLRLDDDAPGRARFVLDRDEAAPDAAWFTETVEPAGTRVSFRFRASADGHRFGAWADEPPPEGRHLQVEVELRPDGAGAGPSVHAMGLRRPD